MCGITRGDVWHDSLICVTWLIDVCEVTHWYVKWLIDMWSDSLICVTWLIEMCDMTHWYVRRDSLMCDVTHWYMWLDSYVWHDSSLSWQQILRLRLSNHGNMTHSYTCNVTHSYVCDTMTHSNMRYTMTHWYVGRDALMCCDITYSYM